MASTRRKSAAIALAIVGVAGLSLASAAQLNIGTGSLGAGASVVAACQATPITVAFAPAAYVAPGAYKATQVTLGAIAATCNNHSYRVQATGAAGIALGTEAVGTTGVATTVVVPLAGVDAAAVTGISVIFYN
jgi:hypothetical protein